MAITVKRTLHPTDDVVNQNHAAVLDAFNQANAVLAAQAINATVGNRITDASVVAGRALVGTGSAFPVPAATNQLWYRTDRGILYYYDGTRWLSVQEFHLPLGAYNVLPASITVNVDALAGAMGASDSGSIYMTKWVAQYSVAATNTLASHWDILIRNAPGTAIDSFSSHTAGGAGVNLRVERALASVRTVATDMEWDVTCTKAGATATPGTLSLVGVTVHYRLIG